MDLVAVILAVIVIWSTCWLFISSLDDILKFFFKEND